MTVRQMIDEMQLTPLTCPDPERVVTGGYVGDLLSWVMGRARSGQAWITIMSNINTVAVASLADVACVILAEGKETVTVMAEGAGSGTSQKTGRRNVTLYTTDNGYQYYTDTTSSGVTP